MNWALPSPRSAALVQTQCPSGTQKVCKLLLWISLHKADLHTWQTVL